MQGITIQQGLDLSFWVFFGFSPVELELESDDFLCRFIGLYKGSSSIGKGLGFSGSEETWQVGDSNQIKAFRITGRPTFKDCVSCSRSCTASLSTHIANTWYYHHWNIWGHTWASWCWGHRLWALECPHCSLQLSWDYYCYCCCCLLHQILAWIP